MEYIKPMFLLLFVLGIVAAVSSRHAAKHYPVEDAGNQDESSLVKKTLKRQGSSLTSAFDISEEKNERKVSSVSDMGDSLPSLAFDVSNPKYGVSWSDGEVYLKQGKAPVPLPVEVSPGNHMHFHVTETKNLVGLYPGAAGVFTYYMVHKDLTLAVMFLYGRTVPGIHYHLYNVRVYPGRRKANKDLYEEMKSDKPYSNSGLPLKPMTDLGSGFSGLGGIVSIGNTPTVVIEIEMPPSYYKSTTE